MNNKDNKWQEADITEFWANPFVGEWTPVEYRKKEGEEETQRNTMQKKEGGIA